MNILHGHHPFGQIMHILCFEEHPILLIYKLHIILPITGTPAGDLSSRNIQPHNQMDIPILLSISDRAEVHYNIEENPNNFPCLLQDQMI